jgi:acyl-CoA thioesterase FadM
LTSQVAQLQRSTVEARPRFEGSNICTWIGFKHVMYLVEEAVLNHLRESGLTPRRLYEEHGLGVEIVDCDARILSALHMDDLVRTVVTRIATDDREMAFQVESFVDRDEAAGGEWTKAVTAKVRVVLHRTADAGSVPAELEGYTVAELDRGVAAGVSDMDPAATGRGTVGTGDGPPGTTAGDENAVAWQWRIPYFYCHFSERLQHSGYLRVMEEVVDVFLAERGISIRTMLDQHRWIPVVPRARVNILRDAYMEEELHTVFAVTEVFKDLTYTASMDCYVRRAGRFVHTATGTITHGYALVVDRSDWKLVPFDERTLTALRGRPGPRG